MPNQHSTGQSIVETAADAYYARAQQPGPGEHFDCMVAALTAAAPLIRAKVRAQVAEEIAVAIERADTSGWPGGRQSEVEGCRDAAAAIARQHGESRTVTPALSAAAVAAAILTPDADA